MEDRFTIYKGKDGEEEIYIKYSLSDFIEWNKKHDIEGTVKNCDKCGIVGILFYVHPELGHKSFCEKCHKDYIKNVEWKFEKTNETFDSIISFILQYDLDYSKVDYATVNSFFESKGHNIKIEDFITRFKDDYK